MDLRETIGGMQLFQSFSEQELQQFAKCELSLRRYPEGEPIIREGDKHASLYLLIKGTASVTKKGSSTLATLEPGNLFGEMAFSTARPRATSIVANEDVLAIRMDNEFFERIGHALSDKIKQSLIALLVTRLDGMNAAMAKIAKFARHRAVPT